MNPSPIINHLQKLGVPKQARPALFRRSTISFIAALVLTIAVQAHADTVYVVDAIADKVYTTNTSTGSSTAIITGLSWPVGLAVDKSGDLFIANNGSGGSNPSRANTITEYSAAGVISTFATGLSSPTDVAIDSSGNLYVRNDGSGTITKITSGGSKSTFASGFSSYDDNSPNGMVFDSHGNMYVASGTQSSDESIVKISSTGVKTTYSSNASNGDLLNNPAGLTFDNNGNLYVANSNAHDIIKIASNGAQSVFATLPTGQNPSGVAFDSKGNLFVGTYGTQANNFVGNLYEYQNGVSTSNPVVVGSGLPYDVLIPNTTPVPEPSGALLICIAGLLVALRRSRPAQSPSY